MLIVLAMLPLACSAARAAEAAAAKATTISARFDDRFPKALDNFALDNSAPDNFADRFALPQPTPAQEPPPKRVVTTIERFPRRGGEVRASDARRQATPPVVAPASSVRAY